MLYSSFSLVIHFTHSSVYRNLFVYFSLDALQTDVPTTVFVRIFTKDWHNIHIMLPFIIFFTDEQLSFELFIRKFYL